jgi:quercetin dioxygenase-like cupin family protein
MQQEDAMTTTDLWTLNSLVTLRATAAATGGTMGAFEQWLTPAGNVPLHVHTREDEAFYVVAGRLTFYLGDERRVLGPGDFAFAPRDIPHQFTVDSDEARMFVVVTPGGFESFFAEVGTPASSRTLPSPEPPDMEKVGRAAAGYGVELLGPPLGLD